MSEISVMYRDTYRIVNSVSRYISYRETSVSLQPYVSCSQILYSIVVFSFFLSILSQSILIIISGVVGG